MPRIKQKDIADALGVHVTTVSKALKNHPGVAEATRLRVMEAAEKMGYRPDPVLQSLVAYRQRNASPVYRATLAWFCNYPEGSDMRVHAGYDDYLAGAREEADRLGYRLDVFHNPGDPRNPAPVFRTLRARGIRGMVLAPQACPGVDIAHDFADFSVVTIGFTLTAPRVHLVTNDHFGTMLTMVERVRALGHVRPGAYLSEVDNHRMGRRARGALESYSRDRRLPVLRYETPSRKAFLDWLRRHPGLDALITREERAAAWLRQACRPLPVYNYALSSPDGPGPGMYHNNRRIGSAAVDLLARMISRNETGIPDFPLRVMLDSLWVPAPAVRVSLQDGGQLQGADFVGTE
ncbi:MAG: LacI family DNA-binding transcriptional regulator [Verrucomicrobia bacterium]|nr:LacI family DNA-binding transcriptional regulator [Verrucomicrobiota bacterium]MCH8526196.1 LacI family transcriptional regulator [Kiritimatiellia bacterium]